MAPAPPSVAPVSEEAKVLADALNTVKIQVVQMKRYLVSPPRQSPSNKLSNSNITICRNRTNSWTR
jgi:hypothetical protein